MSLFLFLDLVHTPINEVKKRRLWNGLGSPRVSNRLTPDFAILFILGSASNSESPSGTSPWGKRSDSFKLVFGLETSTDSAGASPFQRPPVLLRSFYPGLPSFPLPTIKITMKYQFSSFHIPYKTCHLHLGRPGSFMSDQRNNVSKSVNMSVLN